MGGRGLLPFLPPSRKGESTHPPAWLSFPFEVPSEQPCSDAGFRVKAIIVRANKPWVGRTPGRPPGPGEIDLRTAVGGAQTCSQSHVTRPLPGWGTQLISLQPSTRVWLVRACEKSSSFMWYPGYQGSGQVAWEPGGLWAFWQVGLRKKKRICGVGMPSFFRLLFWRGAAAVT